MCWHFRCPGAAQELGTWESLASRAGPPEQDLGKSQASGSLRYICDVGFRCLGLGPDTKVCRNERLKGLPYNPLLPGTYPPGPGGFVAPALGEKLRCGEVNGVAGVTAHTDFEDVAPASGCPHPGSAWAKLSGCQAGLSRRESMKAGGGKAERADGSAGEGATLHTQEEPAVCPGGGGAGRAMPLPPDWPLTGARCRALWASVSPPVRSEKDGPDWADGSQPSHAQGAPLLLLVACS